jgi:hypothetical protein
MRFARRRTSRRPRRARSGGARQRESLVGAEQGDHQASAGQRPALLLTPTRREQASATVVPTSNPIGWPRPASSTPANAVSANTTPGGPAEHFCPQSVDNGHQREDSLRSRTAILRTPPKPVQANQCHFEPVPKEGLNFSGRWAAVAPDGPPPRWARRRPRPRAAVMAAGFMPARHQGLEARIVDRQDPGCHGSAEGTG